MCRNTQIYHVIKQTCSQYHLNHNQIFYNLKKLTSISMTLSIKTIHYLTLTIRLINCSLQLKFLLFFFSLSLFFVSIKFQVEPSQFNYKYNWSFYGTLTPFLFNLLIVINGHYTYSNRLWCKIVAISIFYKFLHSCNFKQQRQGNAFKI